MIPKFRAWWKSKEKMIEVRVIDWNNQIIDGIYPDIELGLEEVILMKSTGLFDSRSEPVEIYKDDIVKRTSLIPGGSDMIGVVKMLEGCWVIDDGKKAVPLWTEVDKNIVIGNIHEHPELVEVTT